MSEKKPPKGPDEKIDKEPSPVRSPAAFAATEVIQTPPPIPSPVEFFDPFADFFEGPEQTPSAQAIELTEGKLRTPLGHRLDFNQAEILFLMFTGRQKEEDRPKIGNFIDDLFTKNIIEADEKGNVIKLNLSGLSINAPLLTRFPGLRTLILSRCLGITDIQFVESLPQLEWLDVSGTFVQSLDPVKQLSRLQRLDLVCTPIKDISVLREVKSLQYLDLSYNYELEDIETISELENLEYLNVACTKVQKLPSLKKLALLKTLILAGTNIGTLDALEDLPDGETSVLEELNIANTEVEDLKMLTRFSPSLKRLNGNDTKVKSFKPLSKLQALEELRVIGCEVEDISPLRENKKLRMLDLRQTNVSDIAPLKELIDLEELYLGYTAVCDLSPLHSLRKLKVLDVSWLKVKNITVIGECQELEKLFLTAVGAEWQKDFMTEYIPRGIESQFLPKEAVDEIIPLLPKLRWLEMPGYSEKYGNGQFFGEILAAYQRELGIPEELIVRPAPRTPPPVTSRIPAMPSAHPLPGAGRTGRLAVPANVVSPVPLATPRRTGALPASVAAREAPQTTPSSIRSSILVAVLIIFGGTSTFYMLNEEFRKGVQRILGEDIVSIVSSPKAPDTGGVQKPSKKLRGRGGRLKKKATKAEHRSAPKPRVVTSPQRRAESPPPNPIKKIETPPSSFQDTFTMNVQWGESIEVEVEGGKKCDDFQFNTLLINKDRIKILIRAQKGGRFYTGAVYIEHNNSDDIAVTREILLHPETAKPSGIEGSAPETPRVTDQEGEYEDVFEEEVIEESEE